MKSGERETELMRLIGGELDPEAAATLRAELARDADLRASHERLARAWSGIELPVSEAAPPGWRTRLMARVNAEAAAEREGRLDWRLAPGWLRAAAVVALVAGLGLGLEAGGGAEIAPPTPAAAALTDDADLLLAEPTLAESWVDVWAGDAGTAELPGVEP